MNYEKYMKEFMEEQKEDIQKVLDGKKNNLGLSRGYYEERLKELEDISKVYALKSEKIGENSYVVYRSYVGNYGSGYKVQKFYLKKIKSEIYFMEKLGYGETETLTKQDWEKIKFDEQLLEILS